VHAHGHKLIISYPDARRTRGAAGLDSEVARRADENFFERSHVPGNIAPVLGEVENRVADQLARPMVGDVAATIDVKYLGAARGEELSGNQHILGPGVAPQRVDVRVLEEEKRVGNVPSFALCNFRFLQFEPVGVIHRAELFNVAKHGAFSDQPSVISYGAVADR
jgi:hypothetical protein